MVRQLSFLARADAEQFAPGRMSRTGIIGFTLVALGAIISRLARRLAAIDAHQLILRDTRPPVLYLRSFGDDRLKLLTATLGRPSLIERFTLRRFDAFEEVIAVLTVRCGACGHNTELPRALIDPQPLPRCGHCNHEMRVRI